jgi:outer membrane protein assembly factor BamA
MVAKFMRKIVPTIVMMLFLYACSATKFVPNGKYLLNSVHITSDQKDINNYDFTNYLRQNANARWFSLIKVPLYIYDLSGKDSTRWRNKTLRKIGDAPVIYDESQTLRTQNELIGALHNMGYMSASVRILTTTDKKKLDLTYHITAGKPYIIKKIKYDIQDDSISRYIYNDTTESLLHVGMKFDINILDAERSRIVKHLTSNGFYLFNKEYVTYSADTIQDSKNADLELHILPFHSVNNGTIIPQHQYTIKNVTFVTDYNPLNANFSPQSPNIDSINYKGYPVFFRNKLYIKPQVLLDNSYIRKDELYNESLTQRTYSSLNRLSALKYTTIRYNISPSDSTALDCYVLMSKAKPKSVSFELEGTNSEGDLGMAASISTQHRNLFHGSESLTIKLRGAYEAISGLQNSLSDNYTEYGVETNISFPRFLFPFITSSFSRNIRATSVLGLQFDNQQRPEYARTIFSGNWSYRWAKNKNKLQHHIDALDVSYIYLPWISADFRDNYLQNSILKYNYNDQLIARMGYGFSYSSVDPTKLSANDINSYTLRFNIESAGNLLYGMSKLFGIHRNSDGKYAILNIGYEQYLKGDIDYAKKINFDRRNALALHGAFGLAFPYGNSSQMPFIKRYFSGGANSVRGWSVRDLGPGKYKGGETIDFMNRSGDIKLDGNVEYRSKLFWHFCGAAFIDAGNIWTIRKYVGQEGGDFQFDKFYKQIAVAYGLGLRLDFDYFVLRFDGGMKAINPSGDGRDRYPFYHPSFSRDFAFHFAVGYPF